MFAIGSLPVMQGVKLQQMTLLVTALVAVVVALLASDYPVPAGIALALATIKPQLVWLLLLWLMIWTVADLRRRYRWGVSFLLSMAVLWAGSEWFLPHWLPRFLRAIYEYRSFTGEKSVMDNLIKPSWSRILEVLAITFAIIAAWKARREPAGTNAFALILCTVLAVTVLVVPTYGPYNQVLLIPALLTLIKERQTLWRRSVGSRVLFGTTIGLVVWQWIAFIALAILSFILPPLTVERGWAIPFWTVLQIPIGVAALMLVLCYQRGHQTAFTVPLKPGTS
jgi:hypothetical protein